MGPFKCPDCGVWWAGVVHRCQAEDKLRNRGGANDERPVIRPWAGPTEIVTTTPMGYCQRCLGWHAGPLCPNSTTSEVHT